MWRSRILTVLIVTISLLVKIQVTVGLNWIGTFLGMEVQSGSSKVASSSHEDIMFFVCGSMSAYQVKAFEGSGKLKDSLCFTIDLNVTLLPFDCGFCALGPTLYMIGGATLSTTDTYVPNLVSYKIDFNKISRFPKQSLPLSLVEKGPLLNAQKRYPIVIVVKRKIYVFSRCLFGREEAPNFEYLDIEAEKWTTLPQPTFPDELRDREFLYLGIKSHVVEDDKSIFIWVSGEAYNGVFRLDLETHEWSAEDDTSLRFNGKAVCFNNVYYAFKYPCYRSPENTVCFFGSPLSSQVEEVEVAGIQLCPEKAHWVQQCEIGLMGDGIFIGRVGYDSRPDPEGYDPALHLTVQRLPVPMVAGKAKDTKLHGRCLKLNYTHNIYRIKPLYFASWVEGEEERKKVGEKEEERKKVGEKKGKSQRKEKGKNQRKEKGKRKTAREQ